MSKSDFGGLKVLKKVLYDHDNYFCPSFPPAFSLVFSDKFEVFFLFLSPTFLSYEKGFQVLVIDSFFFKIANFYLNS